MVLSYIDTVVVILSDWRDTGAEKIEKEGRLPLGMLHTMYKIPIDIRASGEAKNGKDDANIQGCPETMSQRQWIHFN